MKIQLLSITLLMSSVAFGAEAPEIPANRAEKRAFAKVLAQINPFGSKKKEEKKKVTVATFDPQISIVAVAFPAEKPQKPALNPEDDPLVQVCGGFDGPGKGWGMADGMQMKEDGRIVPKPALNPEDDPLVQVCGGFGDHGDGWGIIADAQMKEDGSIVPKQPDQK